MTIEERYKQQTGRGTSRLQIEDDPVDNYINIHLKMKEKSKQYQEEQQKQEEEEQQKQEINEIVQEQVSKQIEEIFKDL